jgi:hypothetical protein
MLIPPNLEARLPANAPAFLCPRCQCRLEYVGSHTEADAAPADAEQPIELADRYQCPMGCGSYEFVRETHRLRCLGENGSDGSDAPDKAEPSSILRPPLAWPARKPR